MTRAAVSTAARFFLGEAKGPAAFPIPGECARGSNIPALSGGPLPANTEPRGEPPKAKSGMKRQTLGAATAATAVPGWASQGVSASIRRVSSASGSPVRRTRRRRHRCDRSPPQPISQSVSSFHPEPGLTFPEPFHPHSSGSNRFASSMGRGLFFSTSMSYSSYIAILPPARSPWRRRGASANRSQSDTGRTGSPAAAPLAREVRPCPGSPLLPDHCSRTTNPP